MRQAQEIFGVLLPGSLFTGVTGLRDRLFPLPVVFWSFLCQVLITRELHLATTVTDPENLSAAEMGDLYLRRWQVELFLDDAKTTLGLAVLKTRSPARIQRELLMHVIAYNLVRALIVQAGAVVGASFKGTLDRMARWLPELSAKVRRRLVDDLLNAIAEDLVPERPFRREPRVLKRRSKPFQLMNKPRKEMAEIPHRAKRSKRPKSTLS